MTCDQLRDSYELYVLGLLAGEERLELDAHVQRGCVVCVRGLKEAAETASLLALTAPETDPPEDLRRRIVETVRAPTKVVALPSVRRQPAALIPWAVAAALLLASLFFFQAQRQSSAELASARQELLAMRQTLAASGARLARLEDLMSLLDQAETKVVTFGETPTPRGRVLVHPQAGVVLIASRLPQLPQGRTFQMWLVPKSGASPQPAGVFQAEQGRALHRLSAPVDMAAVAAVAVSVEPEGGSPAPTTTPISVIPLG